MLGEIDLKNEATISNKVMYVASAELLLLKNSKQNMAWYNDNFQSIIKEHNNQFVAIQDRQLIAANSKLETLLEQLKGKGIDPVQTLVKYVTDTYTIL